MLYSDGRSILNFSFHLFMMFDSLWALKGYSINKKYMYSNQLPHTSQHHCMHNNIKYYYSILYHSKSIHRIWCIGMPSIWRQDRKSTTKHSKKNNCAVQCSAMAVCIYIVCSYNCPYRHSVYYIFLIGQYRSTIELAACIHSAPPINWMQWKINFPMINRDRRRENSDEAVRTIPKQ